MPFNDFVLMGREPRVPDPPRRVWRDWALLVVAVPTAVVEAFLNPEIADPVPSLLLTLALLPVLLWRRTHPLATVAVAFGAITLSHLAAVVLNIAPVGLFTLALLMILPYSLTRWGSGRDSQIGLGFMVAAWGTSLMAEWTGFGDAIGGLLVMLFPLELGALVRYQVSSREQAIEQAKSATRERLARELHDSVAHHVSAIAIQAQGGRALAAKDPTRAAEVLSVIEEEAARALTEMRNMVGALRASEVDDGAEGLVEDGSDVAATAGVELAPQPGLADIARLADMGRLGPARPAPGPLIEVELAGDLEGLRPAVDTALYRLAQESITNAVRHARNASRVLVRVEGDGDRVELTVTDDGVHNPPPAGITGYGLIGMAERAKLLGGTLSAGPNHGERGWRVNAVLPRDGLRDGRRDGALA